MRKIRVERVKVKEPSRIKIYKAEPIEVVNLQKKVSGMNDIINIKDLFQSKKNYGEMNKEEKGKYILQLADEFLDSADDLMRSLKDK